jgi:hypothetical protein
MRSGTYLVPLLLAFFLPALVVGDVSSKNVQTATPRRSQYVRRGGPTAAVEGFKNSMASGLASICAKSLLQPFDTIKTVQQHATSDRAIGLVEATRIIIEREDGSGVVELYAGLAVSALGSVPAIGLYYGMYSYCKRMLIPLFQSTYGSSSSSINERKPILSDQALKLIAVAISAAIGKSTGFTSINL